MDKPLLQAKNIKKTFNTRCVLDGIDLTLERGAITALIGSSGAGKSTLLSLLAGIEPPTEGELFLRGDSFFKLSHKEQREQRRQIGVVFQDQALFWSRTLFQNVAFPLEVHKEGNSHKRVMELLEWVGLAELKDAYPAQISGGQRQRVAIARALALRPSLLFCDEVTSALDPVTRHEMICLFKAINQQEKSTILVVTHQMEWLPFCDHLVVLDQGKVVETGRCEQLLIEQSHPITKQLLREAI